MSTPIFYRLGFPVAVTRGAGAAGLLAAIAAAMLSAVTTPGRAGEAAGGV